MGLDVIMDDFFAQILSGLIVASIIGASATIFRMHKCISRQAKDISLMKKGISVVLKLIQQDTERLHGPDADVTDIDDIYRELVDDKK